CWDFHEQLYILVRHIPLQPSNRFDMGRVDRIDVFSIFTEMGVYGNISTDFYVRGNISIDLLYFPLVSSFFSFNNLSNSSSNSCESSKLNLPRTSDILVSISKC